MAKKRSNVNLFNYEIELKNIQTIKADNKALIEKEENIKGLINMELNELITKLEVLINNEQLIRTDTFYNIAWKRGYKIERSFNKLGFYDLKLPPVSESEIILSAYEKNNQIKPQDFLMLELPQITKSILKNTIADNPNITTIDLLNKFRIFEYPHYHCFATAETENELLDILELLKKFDKIAKAKLIDLNDKIFNNLSASRKKRKMKEITPGCFDGMCIEKNTRTTPLFTRETNF
jgi:hypothetical protein